MAPLAHLDTHLVVWLYDGDLGLIPAPVQDRLEESQLAVSPMVELELEEGEIWGVDDADSIFLLSYTVIEALIAPATGTNCRLPRPHTATPVPASHVLNT